jgi:glycosyltransferase involved in cell wall biosynthesis
VIRLSLIIATWNRGESLVRTLESVVAQDLAPALWEAVVVDNNSTDNTRELFAHFAAAHPAANLRIVSEPRQGLSHARNRGIAESEGSIIAIIDDDEEVNAGFARAYLDFFDTHGGAAAGGRITPHYDTPPPRWLSPYTERPIAGTLDLGDEVREFPAGRFPGGGNMALRRTALDSVGLFNPDLGRTGAKLLAGEEKDLFARLRAAGEKIYYVPAAQILHIIPRERLTLNYLARVSRMSGITQKAMAGRTALVCELLKWCATLALALFYTLTLRPAKARGLFVLRRNVTKGIMISG